MISTVIAKRYAKALISVAKEEGKLEEYGKSLQDVYGFLESNPDIYNALISPVFPAEVKQSVIEEIIKAYAAEEALAAFLRLLVERGRIQHLKHMVDAFQQLMDEEMGVVRAVVTTAVPFPDDLKDSLAEALAKAAGKKVALELEEDPSIIGGIIAQVGDVVWDGSIRSQLQDIKESIGRGELG